MSCEHCDPLSRKDIAQRITEALLRGVGHQILNDEDHGPRPNRLRAVAMLRDVGNISADHLKAEEIRAVFHQIANDVEQGRVDPFELAQSWTGLKKSGAL